MIRYGDDTWRELVFTGFRPNAERRDAQWVDVELRVDVADETPLPDDLIDFALLVICNHRGYPIQIVPQDEGCDCEYQLTQEEKRQIKDYVRRDDIQALIRRAVDEN